MRPRSEEIVAGCANGKVFERRQVCDGKEVNSLDSEKICIVNAEGGDESRSRLMF